MAEYIPDWILSWMESQSAADVVEVVHGEWIKPYYNRYGHPCHVCSVCGFHASCLDKNYCAGCGAKMDGERRSE